jgi:hypothetical protein
MTTLQPTAMAEEMTEVDQVMRSNRFRQAVSAAFLPALIGHGWFY